MFTIIYIYFLHKKSQISHWTLGIHLAYWRPTSFFDLLIISSSAFWSHFSNSIFDDEIEALTVDWNYFSKLPILSNDESKLECNERLLLLWSQPISFCIRTAKSLFVFSFDIVGIRSKSNFIFWSFSAKFKVFGKFMVWTTFYD